MANAIRASNGAPSRQITEASARSIARFADARTGPIAREDSGTAFSRPIRVLQLGAVALAERSDSSVTSMSRPARCGSTSLNTTERFWTPTI